MTNSTADSRTAYIKNLQSLRFVFSFSILVSHLLGHEFSTFGLGEYGVSGFFMLSGFVLSVAYGRKIESGTFRLQPFFIKQWAKLYPLHIVTFLLAILYEAHYGNFYEWYRLLPPAFLVQSWIPNEWFHYIPNGSSWSLCGFFFFYTLFAATHRWVNRLSPRRLIALLALVLAVYLAIVLLLPESMVYAFIYASPLMRLPEFIFGIALCRLMRSDAGQAIVSSLARCNTWTLTLIEMLVLVAPAISFMAYGHMPHGVRCVSLFWPFVAAQLLLFAWNDKAGGLVTRAMHSAPVMFLGSISFEIYLTHMFVVPSARSLAFRLGFSPVGIMALVITVSVAFPLALAAKRYIVEPAFARLKQLIPTESAC